MGLRIPLHTKIAGVTYGNRQNVIKSLRKNQKLSLVREKNNRYDKNALAIYAGNKQVGYIKKEMAANFVPLLDRGEKYICKISSITLSFFKHISILIYTYLLKLHKKMIERIDKNEGVSVDFKLNGNRIFNN